MASFWTGRGTQTAAMLVLAGTMWGCGGGNGSTDRDGTVLAPATAAGKTADASGHAASGGALAAGALGADLETAAPAGSSGADIDEGSLGALHGRKDVYGITNLAGPPAFRAFINAKGQVAMEYEAIDTSQHVGFFDGQQVINVEPANSIARSLGGLNDKGTVAGQSRPSIPEGFQPFRWSAATGAVVLPSLNPNGDTFTNSINNRNEIVGSSQVEPGGSFRAVRWTASNALMALLTPPGFIDSGAGDINDANITLGSATAVGGNYHVFRWDAAGRPTDLGTFGAFGAMGGLINNRGDFTGMRYQSPFEAIGSFLWLRKGGFLPIVDPAGRITVVHSLNEFGQVAGRSNLAGVDHPFFFSRKTGYVNLERQPYTFGVAYQLNDKGVIVGNLGRPTPEGGEILRAYRWSPGTFTAVDLNTRLLNPPTGLVLTAAFGISAKGDIVANSNAGLVLLRQGGGGTDAPVLGPIQLTEPVRLNQVTQLTLSFRDRNLADTHTATVDWDDGAGPQAANIERQGGGGLVSAEHTYVSNGLYNIVVRVTDSTGKTTALKTQVSINELGGPGDTSAPVKAGAAQRKAPATSQQAGRQRTSTYLGPK
jgi:hypothetical protein